MKISILSKLILSSVSLLGGHWEAISDYGSEVFGFHEFQSLEKTHSRAIRAFIGVPRSTPVPGMRAEMNWLEPRSRTQLRMVRMFHRISNLPESRLTKKILRWDFKISREVNFATWSKEIENILSRNSLRELFVSNIFDLTTTIKSLQSSLLKKDLEKFHGQCQIMPKLRTYNRVAIFNSNKCYLTKPLSFIQRKFLAKLRLGVLGLRIETGRYERPRRLPEERICRQCTLGTTEDEAHFILHCPRHTLLRNDLLTNLSLEDFTNLNENEKLKFLLNDPTIVKQTAQFIVNAFDNREAD